MLEIKLKKIESYTEEEGFRTYGGKTLLLEHSLYAVALWESKWRVSFSSNLTKMTYRQFTHYIQCMSVGEEITDMDVLLITSTQQKEIMDYLIDPMSATVIHRIDDGSVHKKENSDIGISILLDDCF